MLDPEDLKDQLQKALRECALLKEENERLKKLLGSHPEDRTPTRKPSTLFLAMPISWRGTLQQYVGRLHRLHDNKRVV
jgi:regulator of replication initiation timing